MQVLSAQLHALDDGSYQRSRQHMYDDEFTEQSSEEHRSCDGDDSFEASLESRFSLRPISALSRPMSERPASAMSSRAGSASRLSRPASAISLHQGSDLRIRAESSLGVRLVSPVTDPLATVSQQLRVQMVERPSANLRVRPSSGVKARSDVVAR